MKIRNLNRHIFPMLSCMLLPVWCTSANAADLYWDANGISAGFGDTTVGTWGTDAFWTTDGTGVFADSPGVVTTNSSHRVVINRGDSAPVTMNATGDQHVNNILGWPGNSARTITINDGGSGIIHLYSVFDPTNTNTQKATAAVNGNGNDTVLRIKVPVVLEQPASSTVYIGTGGGVNGLFEFTAGISSANSVNLFYQRQHNTSISGPLALSGTITSLQPQPGNPAKRQTFTINSVIPSTVTDITMSGGDSAAMVLSGGGNLYSGRTTVNSGTFRTTMDSALPDTTDVYINTSAVVGNHYGTAFHLSFSGSDRIDELFFDGVAQVTGTWGAVGNAAADHTSAFLTGPGLLIVTTGPSAPSAYDNWVAGYALFGGDAAADFDFDKDGLANGIEFVAGSNPRVGTASPLLPAIIGADVTFTFERTIASKTSDTLVAIQVSPDLSGWPEIYEVPAATNANFQVVPNGATEIVTLTLPRGTDAARFARLRVQIDP